MSDVDLDLDVIAPQPKTIRLGGKILTCYPLTVNQLLDVIKLQGIFANMNDTEDAQKLIRNAFEPLIPELKKDPSLKLYFNQMKSLIEFAQKISIPDANEENKEVRELSDPKKKVDSPEALPTSSGSIQGTQ
jgi:hypothetical protein